MKFLIGILICTLFVSHSEAKCKRTIDKLRRTVDAEFDRLPSKGSAAFQAVVEGVKNQLKQNGSYALIDMRALITKEMGELWFESMPHETSSQILMGALLVQGKKWNEQPQAEEWQLKARENLSNWFKQIISEVVPKGFGRRDEVLDAFRLGTEKGNGVKFEDWHVDSQNAAVSLALEGAGTEILGPAPFLKDTSEYILQGEFWKNKCKDCRSFIVPTGVAILFFGTDSVGRQIFKPVIHRTPHVKARRVLYIGRF